LPLQTPDSFQRDIQTLVNEQVPTITTYRLRNNDRKKLHVGTTSVWNRTDKPEQKAIDYPSEDDTYAMRERAMDTLYTSNYSPSPACFWSLPGTYGNGNIPAVYRNKWQNFDNQVAFGPGVYGWFTSPQGNVMQTHNTLSMHDYLSKVNKEKSGSAIDHGRLMTGREAVAASLAFSYKSMQPISVASYKERFNIDLKNDEPFASVMIKMVDCGFLKLSDDGTSYQTTVVGEALHEEIVDIFLHKYIGGVDRLS